MKNNYLRNAKNILFYNFKTLAIFEILYKLLLGIVLIPISILGFNLSMKITGYTYLTIENIINFLLNPITILILFILLIYLTIVTIFDISSLIVIFDFSYQKKKIGLKDIVIVSFNKCKQIFKIKNISVAFLVLFLIPFLNIGISSNVITSIKIPEFIQDYINANMVLSILYLVVYLFLVYVLSKWLYSLHYMILENKSFKEARIKSKKLIKSTRIKDILKIVLVQIIISLTYLVFILLGILIIVMFSSLFNKIKIVESILITIIWLFLLLSLFISTIVINSSSYAVLSTLFYKHKISKDEKIISINYKPVIKNKKRNIIFKNLMITSAVLSLIFGSLLTYQVVSGKANLNIEYVRNIEITAHRGASVKYPENTLAAFAGAKKLKADWIELDVQQTKDKQIVVSHDTNLKRVTGVNKNIIDMNYSAIEKLDAGSFFDKKFKGEKIPLLSEVLKFAKENNIRLNIELKPTGQEVGFEKQVIDLIKEYNFEKRCVITSQVYSVLENIKKIDKNIKTVYVMSIAIGNITDAKFADAFSVEASNVNTTLVDQVHNDGKELYAWTVNTEESINNMINMNVDNIITDNIELCRKLLIESKSSNLINEVLKNIE